jgi:hypothetical protein
MIAILLMGAGQAAHAYEDFSCATQHAADRQSNGSDQEDCPANHSCCQAHAHSLLALAEVPGFLFEVSASSEFFDRDDILIEGLAREIDYPPQLS